MADGLYCKNARTPEDLLDVFRIRQRVVVDELRRIPESLVADEYDSIATNFAAYVDGTPVGTLRVVRDRDLRLIGKSRFSMEARALDLSPYRTAGREIIEVSRLAVLPEYRREGASYGLFACVHDYFYRHGITDLFTIASCKMFNDADPDRTPEVPRLFTMIGCRPIGDVREGGYYDDFAVPSVPMRLSLEDGDKLGDLYEASGISSSVDYSQMSASKVREIYEEAMRARREGTT